MAILFLDDDPERLKRFRSRIPSATQTEDADATIAALPTQEWDYVFLDHDLGGEIFVDPSIKNCGMEVVRWIEANSPKVKQFIVHSCNYGAAETMVSRLVDAGYEAVHVPFTVLLNSLIFKEAYDAQFQGDA